MAIGVYTKNIFNSPALTVIVIPLIIYFYGYMILNSHRIKIPQNYIFWIFVSILLIFNLFSTFLLFTSNIVFAKTFFDIIISLIYLPIPSYFFLTIFDWYKQIIENNKNQSQLVKVEVSPTPPKSKNIDTDRRRFLKILGGTGVSVLLMSLLNPKQAGAAFFGSVPGPGTVSLKDSNGTKINPAEKQPTDGYKISQIDDADYPYYYGYINSTGAWYIMSEDASSNYRYTKGDSNFAVSWALRATLTYGYFDSIF